MMILVRVTTNDDWAGMVVDLCVQPPLCDGDSCGQNFYVTSGVHVTRKVSVLWHAMSDASSSEWYQDNQHARILTCRIFWFICPREQRPDDESVCDNHPSVCFCHTHVLCNAQASDPVHVITDKSNVTKTGSSRVETLRLSKAERGGRSNHNRYHK
jgi:hypothetical protein